ncbi:MAG: NAD(P)-dependent oxidoreductase [Clostridiales bacterium]|nr:NAD(P)-dependent oxidoreductase [Clostridiales bacterium]
MRLYIDGDDARSAYLAELSRERGHIVTREGPWDFVVLSLPRSQISDELKKQMPKGQKILCGLISDADKKLSGEKGWLLKPILQDSRYTQENAVFTAEGAIHAAMRQADFALSRARCAVIGYGRIGRALTDMLRGLGAQVTVAARRMESRAAAGPGSIPVDELPLLFPHIQLLFNTVPAQIIRNEWLEKLPDDALIIELASPPYGLDLSHAREMSLRAWLESGVPGRYCPKSAAEAMLAYLEREGNES